MSPNPPDTRRLPGAAPVRSSWPWLLPLLLLGAALHWPGGADFKCDDYGIIRYVQDFDHVIHDLSGRQYDLQFFRFWRPIITLSFWIDYQLFGTEPFGYFAMNCAALLLAAVLLFALLRRLWAGPARWELPFAATVVALWLCHPVTGTPLRCWAAGRVDVHYVPPLLLALLLHLRYRRGGAFWPAWAAAGLAIATKESALGFPLLALALDLLDPRPTDRPGPGWRGRRLPGAFYLLLFPAALLLRLWFLGSPIGGYHSAPPPQVAALDAPLGIWLQLGRVFFPETPLALRHAGSLIVVALATRWILAGPGRGRRLAITALTGAALFAPVVQLLEPPESQDARLAYFPAVGVLALWAGTALHALRPRWPAAALAALPLLWMLPAGFVERARMDQHDAFITSLKAALRECDRILPAEEPVVVAGDAMLARHGYRFGWALGSVLKPPFHPTRREVIALWPSTYKGAPPPASVVTDGLAAFVEVTGSGGRVVRRDPTAPTRRRERVAPVGFDGVLDLARVADEILRRRAGYPVRADYTGDVIVCSTVGSGSVRAPAADGIVSLEAILGPIADQFWLPLDLDKDCPLYLVFAHRDGVSIGRLWGSPGFATEYVEWRR